MGASCPYSYRNKNERVNNGMKVIKPIPITSDKVLSSTAVEEYTIWSSATTYAKGYKCVYGDKIYESLLSGNVNKTPGTNPNSWLNIGANNKMSMFDVQVNTQTKANETLSAVIKPGASFNSLAILNIKGRSVSISVKDSEGGVIVYSQTMNLDNSPVSIFDWYTYFFEDFDFRSEAIFPSLPVYNRGVISITISSGAGEQVAIGNCVVGNMIDLGATQYGLNYGIRDYSVKETTEFGDTKFVERAYSKRMSPTLMLPNTRLNYISKILQDLRATPTVYIGSESSIYQGTIVFGFLKDWNIEISYPNHSMLSVEVDGLI